MRSDSPIVPTVVCFLLPLMLVFVGMEVSMAHSGEAEPPTVTAPENQSLSPNDPAAHAADGGRFMPAADSGFAHKPARDPNRPPGDALEPVDWPMLRDAHWRNFLIGAGGLLITLGLLSWLILTNSRLRLERARGQQRQALLEQSEGKFRTVFSTVDTGLLMLDGEGRLIDGNPAARVLFGEILDGGLEDFMRNGGFVREDGSLLPPDELPGRRSLATGEPVVGAVIGWPVDGTRRWFRVSSQSCRHDAQARPCGAMVSFFDITSQVEAAAALKKSQQRLESALAGSRAGSWEWNIQSGELTVDERWAQILGYTLAGLGPLNVRTWAGWSHPDDRDYSNMLMARHLAGELDYYECQLRMKHRDGHWVWVAARGQVCERDGGGKPLRVAGTHIDISSDKRIEDMLRSSEACYRTVVDSIREVIFQTDSEGRFTFLNPAWRELVGHSVLETLGTRFLEHLHPDDRRGASRICASLHEGGDGACRQACRDRACCVGEPGEGGDEFREECRYRHQDGSFRWVEMLARALRDDSGQVIGMTGTLLDITARKQA